MKLGKAFSDNVIQEQKVTRVNQTKNASHWWTGHGRLLLFASALFFSLFVLVVRLFDLTVVRGHEYRNLSDGNRIRELIIHAPRGLFLDRTGKPLVQNIDQYRLNRPCEEGVERDTDSACVETVTKEDGDHMLAEGLDEGVFLENDYLRQYTYPSILAHILGYTGEITAEELEDEYYSIRNYRPGDKIGRLGAEAVYEEQLRGRDGKELVEVAATGEIVRTLGRQAAVQGQDVTLSLDLGISQVAAQAFPKNEQGAVIVSKPSTGEILALYSSPSFDSNMFSRGVSQVSYEDLLYREDKPLINRAIGGVYPPGSTFKLVSALAALEEEAVTPETVFEDTGVIEIGPFSFANWYFTKHGKTDGMVDVFLGLQRSNDVYFYKLGEALGITRLARWARKFGIDAPLGIELAGEASGLMPDPAWKESRFSTEEDIVARNHLWFLGDTYHVSIGQGYLLTTPLQVNAWTNAIANGGKLCRPTIKKQDERRAQRDCRDLDISEDTIEVITEGLRRACAPRGTGWPFFDFTVVDPEIGATDEERESTQSALPRVSVPVACKTGTSEFGDPDDRTHAWFTIFAPIPEQYNDGVEGLRDPINGLPEISVTVLVEGAGEGSDIAAPVAKAIVEEWFNR